MDKEAVGMEREIVERAAREAGGIVHRDGNIFFTDYRQMKAAITLAQQAEQPAMFGGGAQCSEVSSEHKAEQAPEEARTRTNKIARNILQNCNVPEWREAAKPAEEARGVDEGEWEALAIKLCEEEGHDPYQLIWSGGPIPEPWGDRWMKYESDAKRMIQLVREFAAPAAGSGPITDALDFTPDDQHTISDMANVGYALMQAIKAHRPDYAWNESPAEIVRDLVDEIEEAATGAQGLTAAARDVLAERQRQIEAEGWTPERDDEHADGQMALAAGYYALASAWPHERDIGRGRAPSYWPWEPSWWKPTTPRRNLVKACALGLAEIERLDRAASKEGA